MYYSIIKDDKFLVIVADGVCSVTIMELPTEELADKVAFELQTAWDEGEEWGANQKWKELDADGFHKEASKVIKKFRSLSVEEQEAYGERLNRRYERQLKVKEARRWQSVLSWKRNVEKYCGDN